MSKSHTYLVATIKDWNIRAFHLHTPRLPGAWHLISEKEQLSIALIEQLQPRYIFFPHWSWIVPEDILKDYECVCFHMTDLPYGRGGSPLQNLIARGHKETQLSALRMTKELDAGPVYLKKPLSLAGRAQDIFEKQSRLVYEMVKTIIENEPDPVEQHGKIVQFKRRTPDMSLIPEEGSLIDLYDHIRMLDAETYPKAFLDHGAFKLYFEAAEHNDDGTIIAKVHIVEKKEKD